MIDESFPIIERSGARWYEAEVHRLKGELLLAQDASNAAQAEKSFRTAIEISRKQHAKSWELRATTSLARLLAKQGHRDEARAMLAEIYDWFTEGFDTADLKDAKALLDELSILAAFNSPVGFVRISTTIAAIILSSVGKILPIREGVAAAGGTVSIVIPVYNEAANLRALWERLRPVLDSIVRPSEVIFIDDGSSDSSLEILREFAAADGRVRVVELARNFGQHAAIMAGFRECRGDVDRDPRRRLAKSARGNSALARRDRRRQRRGRRMAR